MTTRKPFLLRIAPEVLEALRRWADEDLRSMNGQVEFLLRRALSEAGRLPKEASPDGATQEPKRQGRSS